MILANKFDWLIIQLTIERLQGELQTIANG